ncbi:hypothetical protein N8772_04500 [Rickettsiales bacterium]|nr:hypothetical protein [Rickettsiales bacterium]
MPQDSFFNNDRLVTLLSSFGGLYVMFDRLERVSQGNQTAKNVAGILFLSVVVVATLQYNCSSHDEMDNSLPEDDILRHIENIASQGRLTEEINDNIDFINIISSQYNLTDSVKGNIINLITEVCSLDPSLENIKRYIDGIILDNSSNNQARAENIMNLIRNDLRAREGGYVVDLGSLPAITEGGSGGVIPSTAPQAVSVGRGDEVMDIL